MNRCRQKALAQVVILALVYSALSLPHLAWAGGAERSLRQTDARAVQIAVGAIREPTAVGMIIDGIVVRPLGLVATVLGTVAFVITLPFSALGGNVGQAGENLVLKPAAFTFTRCLGCFGDES